LQTQLTWKNSDQSRLFQISPSLLINV